MERSRKFRGRAQADRDNANRRGKAAEEHDDGGLIPWIFADIETYRCRWAYGTEARLAFELQFWAGCRISDSVGLGPDNVDHEGWLVFIQKKTKSEVSVPFDRGLPKFAVAKDLEHLHRAIAAMGPRKGTFMLTERGKPRSSKGASQWFSERAQIAGVPEGKTSHGLRKSRMILHAEHGADIHQIAAWSGHETLKEIESERRSAGCSALNPPHWRRAIFWKNKRQTSPPRAAPVASLFRCLSRDMSATRKRNPAQSERAER